MKDELLINRLLLLSASAAGLHALWDAFQNSATIATLDLAISLWLLVLLLLNNKGHDQFVRWAVLLSLSLMLLVLGSLIPKENGLHLLFFPLLCSTFILFRHQQLWTKIAGGGIIFCCYFLLEASNFHLFGNVPLLKAPDRVSFMVNFFTAGGLLFLILWYTTVAYHKAEQHLQQMAQEVREQNELLTKANEELDRFVYSSSHDLKAPLASINGLLQILETRSSVENLQPYLGLVQNRIHSLEHFIEDITQYARNARTRLQLAPVALHLFIKEVLDSHRFLHPEHKLELRQLTDPATVVVSDPQRLLTILNNLVSNAIKYHRLENSDPYIAVGAETAAGQLHLWIEDNGPGIDPAVQARMFEMFYRGDERSKGSGLGLYIVKEALEKLDGRLEVSSELGIGTTFHVWIPIETGTEHELFNSSTIELQG